VSRAGRSSSGARYPTKLSPPRQPGRVTRVAPVHRGSSLLVVAVEGPPYIAARPAPRHSTSRVCSIEEVRNDAPVLPRTAARCSHGLGPDRPFCRVHRERHRSGVTRVRHRGARRGGSLRPKARLGSGDPLSPKASGPKTRNRRSDQLHPFDRSRTGGSDRCRIRSAASCGPLHRPGSLAPGGAALPVGWMFPSGNRGGRRRGQVRIVGRLGGRRSERPMAHVHDTLAGVAEACRSTPLVDPRRTPESARRPRLPTRSTRHIACCQA
jgi:hypothetical protein